MNHFFSVLPYFPKDDKTPQRQRTKTRNQNRVEMESNCFSPVLGNEEDNEVFNP